MRIIDRRTRGSAMTELVVTLFPYAIICVGVIIIGHLAIGRQEAQKANLFAAATPGEQTPNDILDRFFLGWNMVTPDEPRRTYIPLTKEDESVNGIYEFEENTDYDPEVDYATEEPVLPYDDDGEDIHAVMIRLAFDPIREPFDPSDPFKEPEIILRDTKEGLFFQKFFGFAQGTVSAVESDTGTILGGWLDYSQARSRYGFEYGGELFQGEEIDDPEKDLRGEIAFGAFGTTDWGLSSYSAARTDVWRGTHQPPQAWQAQSEAHKTGYRFVGDDEFRIDAFQDIEQVSSPSGLCGLPGQIESPSGADLKAYWDIAYSP